MVSSKVMGGGKGSNQGLVDIENNARAHIYIGFYQSYLRVELSLYKLESAKYVTVISSYWLCLTSGPHVSDWLEIQPQPALSLALRAICTSLRPATVGLWSLPSLRPPRSPASSLSLETLKRPDPKTRVLCTPNDAPRPHIQS